MERFNSRRKLRISGFEEGVPIHMEIYLRELLDTNNDTELAFTIQDEIDTILDLAIDQSVLMSCNRNLKDACNQIIVWRIQ